jgi:aspartate oxidase
VGTGLAGSSAAATLEWVTYVKTFCYNDSYDIAHLLAQGGINATKKIIKVLILTICFLRHD